EGARRSLLAHSSAARVCLQLPFLPPHPTTQQFKHSTTLAGVESAGTVVCFGGDFMKPKWVLSSMLLAAISLPAQNFGGARLVQNSKQVVSPSHYYLETAAKKTVPKRRSKKKSAAIVGGSALGGAAIGGLAGGKKGA